MREVFPREESVDCLSCLISAEFKGWRVRGGRKTGSPGHLKPRVWNSEHLRNAGGQGKSSRALELAAVRLWGARPSVSFLCFAPHRRPALEEEHHLSGLQKHRFVPPLGCRSPAAYPSCWTPAGPSGLPASVCRPRGPRSPVLSGGRRDHERPSPVLSSAAVTGSFGFLALDV